MKRFLLYLLYILFSIPCRIFAGEPETKTIELSFQGYDIKTQEGLAHFLADFEEVLKNLDQIDQIQIDEQESSITTQSGKSIALCSNSSTNAQGHLSFSTNNATLVLHGDKEAIAVAQAFISGNDYTPSGMTQGQIQGMSPSFDPLRHRQKYSADFARLNQLMQKLQKFTPAQEKHLRVINSVDGTYFLKNVSSIALEAYELGLGNQFEKRLFAMYRQGAVDTADRCLQVNYDDMPYLAACVQDIIVRKQAAEQAETCLKKDSLSKEEKKSLLTIVAKYHEDPAFIHALKQSGNLEELRKKISNLLHKELYKFQPKALKIIKECDSKKALSFLLKLESYAALDPYQVPMGLFTELRPLADKEAKKITDCTYEQVKTLCRAGQVPFKLLVSRYKNDQQRELHQATLIATAGLLETQVDKATYARLCQMSLQVNQAGDLEGAEVLTNLLRMFHRMATHPGSLTPGDVRVLATYLANTQTRIFQKMLNKEILFRPNPGEEGTLLGLFECVSGAADQKQFEIFTDHVDATAQQMVQSNPQLAPHKHLLKCPIPVIYEITKLKEIDERFGLTLLQTVGFQKNAEGSQVELALYKRLGGLASLQLNEQDIPAFNEMIHHLAQGTNELIHKGEYQRAGHVLEFMRHAGAFALGAAARIADESPQLIVALVVNGTAMGTSLPFALVALYSAVNTLDFFIELDIFRQAINDKNYMLAGDAFVGAASNLIQGAVGFIKLIDHKKFSKYLDNNSLQKDGKSAGLVPRYDEDGNVNCWVRPQDVVYGQRQPDKGKVLLLPGISYASDLPLSHKLNLSDNKPLWLPGLSFSGHRKYQTKYFQDTNLFTPEELKVDNKACKRAAYLSYIFKDNEKIKRNCHAIKSATQRLNNAGLKVTDPSNGAELKLSFNLDHALIFEVEEGKGANKYNSKPINKIQGGHYLFQGTYPTEYNPDIAYGPYIGPVIREIQGCQERTFCIMDSGTGKIFKKVTTLFPEPWSIDQCADAMLEALQTENYVSCKKGTMGKLLYRGQTKEGIIICFIINPENRMVETCYPDLDWKC